MSSQYSAAASAIGYLYQARYALLIFLQKGSEDSQMSLERFDDVAFEEDGNPLELIQTKHHINSEVLLSDSSNELWKTIRIWCDFLLHDEYEDIVFTLITTSRAPDNSVAKHLSPDSPDRNEKLALETLRNIVNSSSNQRNRPCYEAFLALGNEKQEFLLNRTYVLDSSPNISNTKKSILHEMRLTTRIEFLESIYERLEGWWFQKVIEHLSNERTAPIYYNELRTKIHDIQEQFFKNNLPIDFPEPIEMDETDLTPERRIFIEQLKIVMVSQPRIRKAISDYYRAFEQRSKWVREELLLSNELESYEKCLKDEWERLFEIMKEDIGDSPTDMEKIREGRALFNTIDQRTNIPIRPKCTEPYVMRGSYHILANELAVGWHLEFVDRLRHLLLPQEGEA